MNQIVKPQSQSDIIDLLLADTAIRVQLSPTNYSLAVSRADALSDWIDRPDSPLHGRVVTTYAQGSMAINATIARRLRTDEFDIDLIAQLVFPPGTTAKQALDELYRAVRGEPGSRYYDMVERHRISQIRSMLNGSSFINSLMRCCSTIWPPAGPPWP